MNSFYNHRLMNTDGLGREGLLDLSAEMRAVQDPPVIENGIPFS
jgi:hypothetical protein